MLSHFSISQALFSFLILFLPFLSFRIVSICAVTPANPISDTTSAWPSHHFRRSMYIKYSVVLRTERRAKYYRHGEHATIGCQRSIAIYLSVHPDKALMDVREPENWSGLNLEPHLNPLEPSRRIQRTMQPSTQACSAFALTLQDRGWSTSKWSSTTG